VLAGDHIRPGVEHGGYVLADSQGTPQVILISSGSEVHLAHEAYKRLTAEGVRARVVSIPCWRLFDEQDATYRENVLPAAVTARVSIEAGSPLGWDKYVGLNGTVIGLDHFGASAPCETLYKEFGLTPEAVVDAAKKLI